jgi:hypothetical protein
MRSGVCIRLNTLFLAELSEHHAAEVKRWLAFMTETGLRK